MYIHKEKQQQLWDTFRKGESKALGNLFEAFSDSLFDYGSRFTLNKDLVEDCIQDLFLRLHNNREKLPLIDNLQFYLFRSLKNIMINAMVKNQRYVYVSPQDLPFFTEYKMSHNPEAESFPIDMQEKLQSILNTLSARQREAIYLRYQEGMTYDEVSQLLNMKYQSARNLIHRSMKKIREEMNLSLFLVCVFSNDGANCF